MFKMYNIEYQKVSGASFLYDGGYDIAKKIVEVFHNSKDFTLQEYEGRDDFYLSYLLKIDEFIEVSKDFCKQEDVCSKIRNLRKALMALADRRELTFSALTYAFAYISWRIEKCKGVKPTYIPFIDMTEIKKLDTYEDFLRIGSFLDPHFVPFTTVNGIFGYNTYLFLWSNGIKPVAVTLNPSPVHNGTYTTPWAVLAHDFIHYESVQESSTWLYEDLISHKDQIPLSQLKSFILIMFTELHEINHNIGKRIEFSTQVAKYDTAEAYYEITSSLIKAGYYTPEKYGLDKQEMLDAYPKYRGSQESMGEYIELYWTYILGAYQDCLNDLQDLLKI